MSRRLQMVGFFVEDGADGPKIVLVQPYTHDNGETEEIEHETSGPDELWSAFIAMIEDPGEPATQEPARDDEDYEPGSAQEALMRAGLEEAEHLVNSAMGPIAGRLAGALLRNPAHVRALGKRVAAAVTSVSRGPRTPRTGSRW